jgi:deoxyribodipyrimidine photo-lyase
VAPTVLWLRRDLRFLDHPALAAASAEAGREGVLSLFVLDPVLWAGAGAPRRAFLAACLREIDERTAHGLVVRYGDPVDVVTEVAREVAAERVYVSADFGPYGRRRDTAVGDALRADGRRLIARGSAYAVDPGTVRTGAGTPYKVFTPFRRAWVDHGWDDPDEHDPGPVAWCAGVRSDGIPAAPAVDGLPKAGETAARRALDVFLDGPVDAYADARNRPDLDRTSRLSPYLKLGCIHPRTVLARLGTSAGAVAFRSELCWREFYADVLWHNPGSARTELNTAMAALPVDDYERAQQRFASWCEGRTGYPLIDAGMRQLQGEAWVHNRVRMAVASFLVKDLHVDWRRGARYFMEHLVDGDLASNQHGWQWVAGTGTDAAPYFRVFNPVTQSKRFDPEGTYIARWVPELAGLTAKERHEPWLAKAKGADTRGYPDPIVDHAEERAEALRRFDSLRR